MNSVTKWIACLLPIALFVACASLVSKDRQTYAHAAIDLRILSPQLLITDPVGYYELSWIQNQQDTREEVIVSLKNLVRSTPSPLDRVRYAHSLHSLDAISDSELARYYVRYAEALLNEGKVGVAFSFLGEQFNERILTFEELETFLQVALEHRHRDAVRRLAQELQRRGRGISPEVQTFLDQRITQADWMAGVGTVIVDLGFVSQRGMSRIDGSIGSGFFIDRSGYLITNYHVISALYEDKRQAVAQLYVRVGKEQLRVPAQVVGYSKVNDLALLKVAYQPSYVFSLALADTFSQVGQRVYAAGSPAGLSATLSAGLVSNIERRILPLGEVVQIDVPINPGNSGGPLIDESGTVVGVVFAGLPSFEGLNFAQPVSILRAMLPKLLEGGEASVPFLGMAGYQRGRLVEISHVFTKSMMYSHNVQAGQLLQQINSKNVPSIASAQVRLMSLWSNTLVKLTTSEQTVVVPVHERPEWPGQQALINAGDIALFPPLFGMEVKSVGLNSYQIVRLHAGGIMDELGFQEGDTFEYLGRMRMGVPKGWFVVGIKARIRKMGSMQQSLQLVANLNGPQWI
jgi:serine protease Do